MLGQAPQGRTLYRNARLEKAVRLLLGHVAPVEADQRIEGIHGAGLFVICHHGAPPRGDLEKALFLELDQAGMNHRLADVCLFLQLALRGKTVTHLQTAGENLFFNAADKELLPRGNINNTD